MRKLAESHHRSRGMAAVGRKGLPAKSPFSAVWRKPVLGRFAQVNAAGDVDGVDALGAGSFDVGMDAVADGQDRAQGQRIGKLPPGGRVDGRVGLSGLDDGLAERRVSPRQEARARDKLLLRARPPGRDSRRSWARHGPRARPASARNPPPSRGPRQKSRCRRQPWRSSPMQTGPSALRTGRCRAPARDGRVGSVE